MSETRGATQADPTGNAAEQLVVRACEALRAAAQAHQVQDVATAMSDEIEDAWAERPLRVGVRGDVESRTLLLAQVIGEALDGSERSDDCAVLRVRRGPVARFRARSDDRVEDHVKPVTAGSAPSVVTVLPLPPDARLDARVDAAIDELLAAPVVAAPPAAPPWWAIWAWLWIWLQRLLGRKHEPTPPSPSPPTLAVVPTSPASDLPPEWAGAAARSAAVVAAYPATLCELASGRNAGTDVREILVDVTSEALPAELELVELPDDDAAAHVDLVVAVKQRVVFAVDLRDQRVRRIGNVDDGLGSFVVFARDARARTLTWRAVDVLHSIEATLGDIIASADARFRGRIADLEALHVDDRAAYTAARTAELRPEIIARASGIVKHVLAHVGAELDRIDAGWIHELTEAASIDELQAAVTRLDQHSPTALDQVVLDGRRLLASSLAGATFDLLPLVVAPLVRNHGLPEGRIRDATPPPVSFPILAKLAEVRGTSLGSVTGGWLGGLFKSFDARRSEALAKLKQRIVAIRELANAEILDIEPRLYSTLGDNVDALITYSLDRHSAWLAQRLASEQATIDAERETIRPMIRARDSAHDSVRTIGDALNS